MDADSNAEVIIIGTGQAGAPLAARLARAGRKVVIVERAAVGGTCVNYGCTPTKTLVASARAAHVARTASVLGVIAHDVRVDFPAVMARKDAVVDRWRTGVEHHLASAGENLKLVRGHARFVGQGTIEVGGARYQAENVVINVGARPMVPEVPGLSQIPVLSSSTLLNLRVLPRHLAILGGGYIGCEMAQMFRRFGAEVTIIQSSPRLLPREDPDSSQMIADVFRAEGIALVLGRRVHQVEQASAGGDILIRLAAVARAGHDVPANGAATGEQEEVIRASHLLVATGRRPNTDDLGCELAGVAVDGHGYVEVDERYETTAAAVFAVGDCVPGPQFTHVSWDDHRVLFDILTGKPARARTDRLVPYTVFTDPQVAGVGLSEREARARGVAVEVAQMPFGQIARAIETGETAGVVKVLIDPSSERILGAHIVGVDAGELIHVFSVLMQAKASVRAIVDGEFVHPTFAEGLQTAVMKLPRFALS